MGEIYCLVEPAAGVRRGAMYSAGNALAVAIWLVIGLSLGHTFPTNNHDGTDWFSVFLRLLMGLVMLGLGTNLLLKGPRKGKASSQSASKHSDLRAFSIGMGLMAPNFSSLVLFFPALATITRGAPTRAEEFLLIGLLVLITMSPCLIPLLLVGVAGPGGRALLDRINHWLKPKQWALGLLVCFATAIYLIVSGILAA